MGYGKRGFKGDKESNKKFIYSSLVEDGFTHEAASAIVGNILLETGDFKFIEELAPNVNGERGLGLLQWSGSRAKDFEAWLSYNNKSIDNIKDNVEYLLLEMKKKSRHHWSNGVDYESMKKMTSVEEATNAFMNGYLRPNKKTSHSKARLAWANRYDKVFKGEEPSRSTIIEDYKGLVNVANERQLGLRETQRQGEQLINNIDFSGSSIALPDMDTLMEETTRIYREGRVTAGDESPHKQIAHLAYMRYGNLNKEIIEQGDKERQERQSAHAEDINTEQAMTPTKDHALGGYLQPNGRETKFTREEDVVAQDKTSYNPA